jgi:hypothetical protein
VAPEGVDVAYHLVHSLGARNFSELYRRVAENVVIEAERAGVTPDRLSRRAWQ